MPKSRTRTKAKNKKKVYSHQRDRKQGSPKPEGVSMVDYKGLIEHSMEILKLKIEQKHLKQLISMYARNRDVMEHFIGQCKLQIVWLNNKIEEHKKATSIKMKLFVKKYADNYIIPDDFHLGTTDLKNGYVTIENKKGELHTIIMANAPAEFPNDLVRIGTILENDDIKVEKLNVESLLKNEDVLSTILSSKVSLLEDKPDRDRNWYCQSATCPDRKKKINFRDI